MVYQNNRYGPLGDELIGEQVQLRATPTKLNIYHNDRLIASYILVDDQDEEADRTSEAAAAGEEDEQL